MRVFISLGLCTNVRHRAIPQGILLSLHCNNNNLLHMQFSNFKSLLDGCHLMLTEETWFEVGKNGGGPGTCPLQHRLIAPRCLPRLRGGGRGYACNIFSSKWESLQSSDSRLAFSWRVGVGRRSGVIAFRAQGGAGASFASWCPRVGVFSGTHTLKVRGSLL